MAATVLLSTVIVLDHYTTLALRHVFHRPGPPTSPLGTYPSGGCDRVVVVYGVIAYLLWREFSGRRRTAIWAATAIACLAFNEAFSPVYLGLHWFTDSLSGILHAGLQLTVFVAAVEFALNRRPARSARLRDYDSQPPASDDASCRDGSAGIVPGTTPWPGS